MSTCSSVARVGRRPPRNGTQRRSKPIPVAPPRVPTPMPPVGEAEQKIAEQVWRPKKTPQKTSNSIKNDLDEDSPWVNPRLVSHEVPVEKLNELHHVQSIGKKESKRRLKVHWWHQKNSEKLNEKPGWNSDSCRHPPPVSASEDTGLYTYYGFLDHQVSHVRHEMNRQASSSSSTSEPQQSKLILLNSASFLKREVNNEDGNKIYGNKTSFQPKIQKREVPQIKIPLKNDCLRTFVSDSLVQKTLSNSPRYQPPKMLTKNPYLSQTNRSFRSDLSLDDIYAAGVINGSALNSENAKHPFAVAAQSPAAAAFFARAAQKLNLSSPHRRKRHAVAIIEEDPEKSGGFCGAIHRNPPPMPPALLRRIGVREVTGVGKVKVMLRVAGPRSTTNPSFFSVDSRKKQVTLIDPSLCGAPPGPEDRRVGVMAPKMFAFDAIFEQDDVQTDVCANALTDVIHAVINGTDGCLFCFGHAQLGKTATMLGSPDSPSNLGIIPCAISWLFRGIQEQKQRTGARFSVRVSAVEICQATQQIRDLLAGHANDCEQSPGVYLRDDPLLGTQLQNQSELRVPTAEKAAFYLDAAASNRSGREEGKDSHFLYTLHVYQYSVAGKGGVAGGRSRLHLFDLGSCDKGKMGGSIPLSGLGNVLLAIFNGQKHLPYKEHKITQLLRECLGSLTCHAAMIAHVSQAPSNYTDTLTTVQLASRIHRMRRKKIKFGGPTCHAVTSTGSSSDELARQASTGSSDVDPSSSEQSADTVIYVGPADDTATDGEHPPVYIPSLNSVNKSTGTPAEVRASRMKHHSPAKSLSKITEEKASGSPSHKRAGNSAKSSPARTVYDKSKEEHWIDGPRVSKHKVAEARNILLKEQKKEMWVDGPMQKVSKTSGGNQCGYGFMDSHKKSMIRKWVENQTVQLKQNLVPKPEQSGIQRSSEPAVETSLQHLTTFKTDTEDQLKTTSESKPHVNATRTAVIRPTEACCKELPRETIQESSESSEEEKVPPPPLPLILRYSPDVNKMDVQSLSRLSLPEGLDEYDEEDEIELEIVEVSEHEEPVPMQDCCLQVTEEDIALCMGENPLPEVDQGPDNHDHPLRILSQENLTVASTFTDSLSVGNDYERSLPLPSYSFFGQPFQPKTPFSHDDYIDLLTQSKLGSEPLAQLARLHQLYKSKLVLNTVDRNTRCQSLSLSDVGAIGGYVADESKESGAADEVNEPQHGSCSIYSEPPYRLPDTSESICNSCKRSINKPDEGPIKRTDLSSLRHPDGASNPKLNENQRVPGNGASKAEQEDLSPKYSYPKKRTLSDSKKSENSTTNKKETKRQSNLNDDVITHSPSRKIPPIIKSSLNELEESPVTTPPNQKHIYTNKNCPGNGYDSGHDSSGSPRATKPSSRQRAQLQCESSGYESVVSFTSSLESELAVKLVTEEVEEVHDPGGPSGSVVVLVRKWPASFAWRGSPFRSAKTRSATASARSSTAPPPPPRLTSLRSTSHPRTVTASRLG